MNINDFSKLITQAESAAAENEDPKTALIFLHKLLDLVESAADYARFTIQDKDKRIVLANIKHEAHERQGQILGFIQDIVREENKRE